MTFDSYLLRGLVFIVAFSMVTFGLFGSAEAITFDFNTASYFFNVGSVFFAGVFCVGRANKYLLLTFVFIILVSYSLLVIFDYVFPLSAYVRLCSYAVISYVGLVILTRRNQVTMAINKARRDNPDNWFLGKLFKKDQPTRETNLSLVLLSYARLYVLVDVLFIPLSIGYCLYLGVGYNELLGTYIVEEGAYNIGNIRDTALLILDFCMSISLVTHVIYDSRRPDILGVGDTVVYDRALLTRLRAEQK